MSEGAKDGRRSVLVGLVFATALAMDVDNVLVSRSGVVLVSTISTEEGIWLYWFDKNVGVVCLTGDELATDLKVVDGSVILSIDEILVDDRWVVNSLLLWTILFSN